MKQKGATVEDYPRGNRITNRKNRKTLINFLKSHHNSPKNEARRSYPRVYPKGNRVTNRKNRVTSKQPSKKPNHNSPKNETKGICPRNYPRGNRISNTKSYIKAKLTTR